MRDRRSLNKTLKEFSAISNVWSEILDDLFLIEKHFRYYPDSDSSNTTLQTLIAEVLEEIKVHAVGLPPEQQAELVRISVQLEKLSQITESPLKIKISDLVRSIGGKTNAVYLKYEKGRNHFEELLMEIGDPTWTCMSYKELKATTIDSLIIVGSTASVGLQNQIPERLITSNYAKDIYFLDFPLYPDKKFFNGTLGKIAQLALNIDVQVAQKSELAVSDFFDSKEDNEEEAALYARQFKDITANKLSTLNKDSDEITIKCMCFLLAGGQAVFLPDAKGTVDVLNPNSIEGQRVSRKPCAEVQQGEFLVLRVGSSDSEAIRAMADSLAEEKAHVLRQTQDEWKKRLKIAVSHKGLSTVEYELKQRGIQRPWIKEWLAHGSIRPQADKVFEVLLKYLGMEVEVTFQNMNALIALHKRAGFKFREVLKNAFEEIDLAELVADSYLEMEIEDEAGVAKLGSFKCLSISSEVYEVPESAVKRVFEHSEGEIWAV
jgi:hypothetical protein